MTPTLLFWVRIAVILFIVYNLFTIIRTFKKRGHIIPKQKKEWGSLFSDLLFFGLSVFLLFMIRNNYEKPIESVMQFKEQSLPPVQYTDARTGQATILTQKGIIILNIWATWCPPCRKEMPALEQVYKEYTSKGVRVIALTDEDIETAKRFLENNPYTFTVGRFSSSNELLRNIDTRPVSILLMDGKVKDIVVGARGHSFFSEWAESVNR